MSARTYWFIWDTFLNWVLAVSFVFVPEKFQVMIFRSGPLPEWFFRVTGAGFLLFSSWQSYMIVRKSLTDRSFRAAAWMSWIPAFSLAGALFYPGFDLWPAARGVFWAAVTYMFWLGYVYMRNPAVADKD